MTLLLVVNVNWMKPTQKGYDILLETFSNPEIRTKYSLKVIGENSEYQPTLADTDQLREIEFLGWVTRERVLCEISKCNIIVMPSRWEGLSFLALEALCLGTPIVSSDIPSFQEVVINNHNGKSFTSNSAESLSTVLSSIRRDSLEEWSRNSRKLFERKFKATRMNSEYTKLFMQSLSGNK